MTKQTELGIGQTSYVSFRFKVVDFLPWMYVYEFIMQAKRPDPIQVSQRRQGCYMAKFDPFLSLDCARVEGMGAQSKERKGSKFAA